MSDDILFSQLEELNSIKDLNATQRLAVSIMCSVQCYERMNKVDISAMSLNDMIEFVGGRGNTLPLLRSDVEKMIHRLLDEGVERRSICVAFGLSERGLALIDRERKAKR